MTTRTDTGKAERLIESRDDLIATFAQGEKPTERWAIGTERGREPNRLAKVMVVTASEVRIRVQRIAPGVERIQT